MAFILSNLGETIEIPSLEAGFGVELALVVPFNGTWTQMYTYYNHGLELPYGAVRSDAITEAVEVETSHFDNIMRWINKWVIYVGCFAELPVNHNPDLPLDYKLEVVNDDIVLNIVMETLNAEIIWSRPGGGGGGNPGTITFKPRPAFDLSWEGFGFYVKCLKDFASKIKEQ